MYWDYKEKIDEMLIMSPACDKGKKFWVSNRIQGQWLPEDLTGRSARVSTEPRLMVINTIIDLYPAYINYLLIILWK